MAGYTLQDRYIQRRENVRRWGAFVALVKPLDRLEGLQVHHLQPLLCFGWGPEESARSTE
jgi:hypothetical protein